MSRRRWETLGRTGAALAVVATALVATPAVASAATTFTPGDLVLYRVGDGTTALAGPGAPVFLDEYSPTGTLVESIPVPTTASGANKPLVAGGTATSEGELSLSANGQYLTFTGYDAAVGTASLSGTTSTATPRTVGLVGTAGTVDTSTALTDFASGNNPRSATTTDGTHFWLGGAAGGIEYAALGATTGTSLLSTTYKNVRQVSTYDGQLYTSADPTKAGLNVATVGTGLPTTGTSIPADLPFSPALSATGSVEPYGYSFVTLGTGTAPDTLYVADNSTGTATTGSVEKYGLQGGSWVAEGSVALPGVVGVTADDTAGSVALYATTTPSAGTSGSLYALTDNSGLGGTLTGTPTLIASSATNEAFRGVAFAPGTVVGTGSAGSQLPEVPTTLLLPVVAVGILGGVVVLRRRRRLA